jgi:hypothetical protein
MLIQKAARPLAKLDFELGSRDTVRASGTDRTRYPCRPRPSKALANPRVPLTHSYNRTRTWLRKFLLVKKITAFALVALVLTGCSSPEKQVQQAQQFVHDESSLAAAQRNAAVDCGPEQCDAAWALTKRYIEQHSDTPVTRADAVAIDTDVPSDSGKAAFSATRVAKGTGATLTLFAQCRGMYGQDEAKGSDYDECADKILKTQNGYVAFLNAHVARQ